MFRKVIALLILVIFCLVPAAALANDSGPYIDMNENLSINVELKSKEAEIGGTLDFTVKLSNNTSNPITDWHIFRIFSNDHVSGDVRRTFNSHDDLSIEPYETIVWNISEQISPSIYFYEEDSLFYTDFQFEIEYEFEDADGFRSNYYYTTKKTPIELTNLHEGSDFLNIVSVENEDTVYLGSHYYSDYDSSISNVEGEIQSNISITSTSGFELENLTLRKDIDEIIEIGTFMPQETFTDIYKYSYWLNESELSSKLPLSLQAVFTIYNKYYAVEYIKNIPAKLIDMPQLELTLMPVEGSQNMYTLSVKNISGVDYANFYFDGEAPNFYFDGEASDFFSTSNLIDNFASDQTFKTSSFNINSLNLIIGYTIDEKLFVWHVSYYEDTADDKPEEIDTLYFLEPIAFIDGHFVIDVPEPSPSQSPSRTPAPSRTPMPKPTPLPVNTQKPSPTPKPSPTQAPTPEPTASVTVNSVKIIPAVPVWVWIALGCALLTAGVLSFLLYVIRARKEDG